MKTVGECSEARSAPMVLSRREILEFASAATLLSAAFLQYGREVQTTSKRPNRFSVNVVHALGLHRQEPRVESLVLLRQRLDACSERTLRVLLLDDKRGLLLQTNARH
jgi:hypothetical protein